MERRAPLAQLVDDGLVHRADDLARLGGVDARHRASRSPCRRCSGPCRRRRSACSPARAPSAPPLAVAQRQQRQLLALQVLLDDHAARPEAPRDRGTPRAPRAPGLVGRDHDALARGQPVELDARPGSASIAASPSSTVSTARQCRGRHARRLHDLLGERLRALQPAAARVGPNAALPSLLERVDEPRDQRRLGTDDGQPDVLVARRARPAPRRRRRRRRTPRVGRDARVARARTAPPGAAASAAAHGRWRAHGRRSRRREPSPHGRGTVRQRRCERAPRAPR